MDPRYEPNDRSQVRRLPERGRYDAATVHAILDEGLVAHVGISVDGRPVVLPMAYGRDGERLLLHGSVASRLQRHLAGEVDVCVTVTLLDGLVLARSSFHHSMDYRSVVVQGTARRLGQDEAGPALDCIVDHLLPGRAREARPPNDAELRKTAVLAVPLAEASAKVRTGGPVDEAEDLGLDVWAGVLPLALVPGDPRPEPDLRPGVERPPSLSPWRRPVS